MGGWWSVLEAARRASRRGKEAFTASDLAHEARIDATVGDDGFLKSPAESIASAWLGKFVRWGYALRAGSRGSPKGGNAWVRLYTLTEFGVKRHPPKASPRLAPKRKARR
jgi:hypothetical protein